MSFEFVFNKEYDLSDLADFVNEKIDSTKVTLDTYVSTDNMIVDRGGVGAAIKLPLTSKYNHFKATDTLFSNIRTYFRKVWLAEFEGGASPDVLVFRTKDSEILDPTYLYYLLSEKKFSDYTVLTSKGAKMPRGDKAAIMQYKVYLPEPSIQREIGGILRTYDLKLKNNTQTNQTLEQIAQALFKSWFVDFDPVKAKMAILDAGGTTSDAELAAMGVIAAKIPEEILALKQAAKADTQTNANYAVGKSPSTIYEQLAQTAALFPCAMQESELGAIPEGWEVRQLSEICKVINGRAYKNTEFKTKGTPIVRIQNLSNGGKTVYSDLELPPEKYIEGEDFIYAWSATFGPHIWRGPKSIYHYHIWKMEVDESVISRYFLYLSMFRKTEAMKNAGTGSIFTHLTKKIMESQLVLVGDQLINQKFSDLVVPIFDQISSLKRESSNLADIRDALLPKLLSGDDLTVEVSNVQ